MAQTTAIQVRRDTALNWFTTNPILLDGEPALETDTQLMKIGDGLTQYNNLPSFDTRVENLTETTTPALEDFMIIFQNNVMKKVNLSSLSQLFGGVPVNAVKYNGEVVTYNGEIVIY